MVVEYSTTFDEYLSFTLVYKIFKTLYRLKQTGRLLNKIIIKFFKKIGLDPTNTDLYILVFKKVSRLVIVRSYIDDLAFVANQKQVIEYIKR